MRTRDGDEHLARHVSALLGSRSLVLNVDACCTFLHKHFDELYSSRLKAGTFKLGRTTNLHDGSQATMAGITISDDGTEVVDDWSAGKLGLGHLSARGALFPV